MEGLAEVTGVAKSFKFTLGSEQARERDLSRFHKHIIDPNKQVVKLGKNIESLKADCAEIRKIRDKLTNQSKGDRWLKKRVAICG